MGSVVRVRRVDLGRRAPIIFPDGATLEIQGIKPGASVASTRTVVNGSGRYRGTIGTVTVVPFADLAS